MQFYGRLGPLFHATPCSLIFLRYFRRILFSRNGAMTFMPMPSCHRGKLLWLENFGVATDQDWSTQFFTFTSLVLGKVHVGLFVQNSILLSKKMRFSIFWFITIRLNRAGNSFWSKSCTEKLCMGYDSRAHSLSMYLYCKRTYIRHHKSSSHT